MVMYMKLKKLALVILMSIISVLCLSNLNIAKATTGGDKYLIIRPLRQSGYGYQVLEKNVWKIVETNSSGSTTNYDSTIYCLKGGPGFGSNIFGSGNPSVRHYTNYFDMKNPSSITSPYVNALPNTNSNTYKALLWLLENIYVPAASNASTEEKEQAEAFKEQLMEAADIRNTYLTDEDIDVVQQLAVWHFTNNGDPDYDVSAVETAGGDASFSLWINSVAGQNSGYGPLSDKTGEYGWERNEEAKVLYNYLVDTAEANAANYKVTTASQPYELANTTPTLQETTNSYVIGPYRINRISDTEGELEGVFTNGAGQRLNPTLQNASGSRFNNLEATIGKDFYIVLPKSTNIDTINFKISGSYNETKITYWAVQGAEESEQPVVIVEREETPYEDSVDFTKPEEEIFDLALRKFITRLNTQDITNRVPQISSETIDELEAGTTTTAEKVHPKNALTVATGDTVVYTIRVYNEGNVDGIVTEITDYLPDGLSLAENSSINTKYGWTEGNNGEITTDYLAGQVIDAFDGTTIHYLDVQIECEVTARVSESNTTLKNVAEITGATNGEGETVTDRDSTPGNVNVPGYGETSQEDDDDFEKLTIPPVIEEGYFDLALRKFITGINEEDITNRVPQISDETIDELEAGTTTTAEKVHPKNALTVATGDRVVYTIRVYNEGTIDGIVTEITDYLPDGLRLAENSSINEEYGWTEGSNRAVTTDHLAGQVIEAFDGTTIHYLDVQIECEVTATATETEIDLKNVAEITGCTDSEGNPVTDRDSTPGNVNVPGYGETSQEDDDDFEQLIIPGVEEKEFDLALRKFITGVNNKELVDDSGAYTRAPVVDVTELAAGTSTTAIYTHPKQPVNVSAGDEVIYTIRVYNEGEVNGYVREITDYLPEGLEFVNDSFNAQYGWTIASDGRTVTTDITSPNTEYSANRDTIYADRKDGDDKVILEAFDGQTLDYIDVQIKCRVSDDAVSDEKLTNIAEVTDSCDVEGNPVTDRDSTVDNVTLPNDETLPNYKDTEINRGDSYIPGQEDDDDFEKVIIQAFDLSLRKFITGVNEEEITDRVPVFNNNNGEYTYEHTKEPIEVQNGDTVIYTLRIYNEGDIAGYAEEVKDDIPEGLEFLPDNTTNQNYRWVMYDAEGNVTENVSEAVTIRTDYLSKAQEGETGRENLIDAFDPETMDEPDYKEVCIAFRVTEPNTSDRIIINTAEISEDSNENGDPVEDIDSTPDNDEDGEDDIDIEQIKVTYFDLALRKFITGVNEEEITNRVPVFTNNNGEYTYEHTKEPVEVQNGDIVIYTIRVYNEGTQAGYAEEVKDDLPEGLEFLPDNEINTEYRWVMYDAEGNVTENVSEAETIRTDYLSKAQEDETGRENLIDAFDQETMTEPDHKDVQIAFRVIEPNTSDRVLINTAEISEDADEDGDPVEDIDSTPDNDEDGEDDIDEEQVKVTYFDLALRKIISEIEMTIDGETYVEQTGHQFEDDPEEIVKIEMGSHRIEEAVIKFTYQIRITNEGKMAGYAEEITDYIPEGLEFVEEDNEGWVLSEDGKTVTTTQLNETLLQPGESTVVEITLRWINGEDNLGIKQNWAEISEDSDENHEPVDDIDSTPDNFKEGEDDIDEASVILSIVTGVGGHYIGVITGVLVLLGVGIFLIKRFVL